MARTYGLSEDAVTFPAKKVHGYTDESIVVDTAVNSGITIDLAERGIPCFHTELAKVMAEGEDELARDQPPYAGAAEALAALHHGGFIQTVLTGNLRFAAEIKLRVAGLDSHVDLSLGGFGSDARDRFELPSIIAQRYAARYGTSLDPDRTVVIGDAPNDIACARHAGFHAITVAHRISREELAEHRPDVILDRLTADEVVATVRSLTMPHDH